MRPVSEWWLPLRGEDEPPDDDDDDDEAAADIVDTVCRQRVSDSDRDRDQ